MPLHSFTRDVLRMISGNWKKCKAGNAIDFINYLKTCFWIISCLSKWEFFFFWKYWTLLLNLNLHDFFGSSFRKHRTSKHRTGLVFRLMWLDGSYNLTITKTKVSTNENPMQTNQSRNGSVIISILPVLFLLYPILTCPILTAKVWNLRKKLVLKRVNKPRVHT